MRGERQIEEEAVCNRKDDLSFRSEMEWNNMLKWVFLVIYCPFSSLLKKPNTFAFGAQMNQRPGCMNNFLFVSRTFYFYFFFKPASQKHKIIILLWTTDQGHSPSRQHLGFYLLSLFIYFPAYILSHSFFWLLLSAALPLQWRLEWWAVHRGIYWLFLMMFFFFVHTFVIQLSGAQDPSVHHLCSDKYTQLKFFSFFFSAKARSSLQNFF